MGLCDRIQKPSRPPRKKVYKGKRIGWRTRKVAKPQAEDFVQTYYLPLGPEPMPWPRHQDRVVVENAISDRVGYWQSWTNPCNHIKWDETDLRRPGPLVGPPGVVADTSEFPQALLSTALAQTPLPPSEVVDELFNTARTHFITTVNPSVLLLNSILELIETVKAGLEKAEGLAEKLDTIRKRYFAELKRLLSTGVSELDANFLAYMFAVKPFIQDVRNIWCSLERARKRLRELIQSGGKAVRVRYSRKRFWEPEVGDESRKFRVPAPNAGLWFTTNWLPSCPPWEEGCPLPASDDTGAYYELRVENYELNFAAQASVLYRLPPCRFENGGGLAIVWASMMGLDRIGSAIWEAIPFSFVVDWFTNVGKQLANWVDGLTKNFPDGEILEQACSFKLKVNYSLYFIQPITGSEEYCGTCLLTRYLRGVGMPDGILNIFEWGIQSPTRGFLSAALTTQRLKTIARAKRWLRRR